MKGYQHNFSDMHQDVYFDTDSRARKARKMLRVLRDHLGEDLSSRHVLDIGCSTGVMSRHLSEHFGHVTGIDIDEKAIAFATKQFASASLQFRTGDAMASGLEPDSVDVVICAHVYEHVPDAFRMMEEILRVLRPGGVCYFAAENRLVLREGDYRLPFLSWLPKALAHRYLRLAGRGDHYYETLYTYWTLRRMTSGFELLDYTKQVLADPERFDAADIVPPGSMTQKAAMTVARIAYWAFPNYIWLLRKPVAPRPGPIDASHQALSPRKAG